ncbi:nuclear transport factor 2 family protein [Roseateles toxinivorans]|uniref:SnoaL-like protein n=1 Tax=Roseateles toxinivorans TaxID=270368 RepID=A0A4R6QQ80_9BURK|nr:nuclear transport factor 2 family protein [Roseateles toxinivorans]TDP72873.1 SnoaL-like protein [Roseateles toxinivorans]
MLQNPILQSPSTSHAADDSRLQSVIDLFEHLKFEDVMRLGDWYSEDCFFKDPFNEVQGLPATQQIFVHMFQELLEPRFVVLEAVARGDQCFLTWDFRFRLKSRPLQLQTIHGSSHLRWNALGRVSYHRDYWDAAEQFYEKLPLLGAVLRWIKRRLAAS